MVDCGEACDGRCSSAPSSVAVMGVGMSLAGDSMSAVEGLEWVLGGLWARSEGSWGGGVGCCIGARGAEGALPSWADCGSSLGPWGACVRNSSGGQVARPAMLSCSMDETMASSGVGIVRSSRVGRRVGDETGGLIAHGTRQDETRRDDEMERSNDGGGQWEQTKFAGSDRRGEEKHGCKEKRDLGRRTCLGDMSGSTASIYAGKDASRIGSSMGAAADGQPDATTIGIDAITSVGPARVQVSICYIYSQYLASLLYTNASWAPCHWPTPATVRLVPTLALHTARP